MATNLTGRFRRSRYFRIGIIAGFLLEASALAVIIGLGVVPSFFGKPIYAWFGIILSVLIPFQVAMGMGWIKRLDFAWHRTNGYVIFFVGAVHATFALSAYFLGVPVQGF